MDYERVRRTLRDLRAERKMGVPELASEAGINKTTLYRLEDLDDSERGPDLETIEKLVTALGSSLTEFFARVEGAGTVADPGQSKGIAREATDPPVRAASIVRGELSTTDRGIITGGFAAVVEALERSTTRLIEAREQAPAARPRAAGEDARPRKHRG
jgi:transcriptional regulator with XRE-family HTH domain